jgi:hypothetical protein
MEGRTCNRNYVRLISKEESCKTNHGRVNMDALEREYGDISYAIMALFLFIMEDE